MLVLHSRFKTFMDEKMAYGFLFLTMIELTDIYYPLGVNKHKTGPNICSSYFQTVNSMHSCNSQEKEKHSYQLSALRLPQTAPQESGFLLRKGCIGTSASVWLPTLPVFCQPAGVWPGLINSTVDWEDPEMK